MKTYLIKATENVRAIEEADNVQLAGKVLNNATRHLFGFWTGYVEIAVIMPTVITRFPLVRGLEDSDLYEVQSRALEKVLEEAAARRMG